MTHAHAHTHTHDALVVHTLRPDGTRTTTTLAYDDDTRHTRDIPRVVLIVATWLAQRLAR